MDRNGFIIREGANDAATKEAPAVARRRRKEEEKADIRLQKWRHMLGTGSVDFQAYLKKHPAKVKRRVRKGIPDRLRGLAWQALSGGRDLLLQNQGLPPSPHGVS